MKFSINASFEQLLGVSAIALYTWYGLESLGFQV